VTDVIDFTASELAAAIREGTVSAVDAVKAYLARIEATDSQLQAWVATRPELTLAHARAIDDARAAGRQLGPLAGVPIAVKDIFNTIDFPTEMGSPIWKGFTPGNDARVIYDLRYRGAIVLGKTATAEFAVHQLGSTRNPHDTERNPGTSSSGSAVAIAAGQAPVALGTQTAGSIIRPSSYCGIYGFKPSFGLLPRTAMLKTTDSLDTVGFMVRGVADLRLVFDVVRVKGRDFPISHAALSDTVRQSKPYAVELFDRELKRWEQAGVELLEERLPAETLTSHEVHARIYERTLSYYFAEESKKQRLISPVLNGMISRGKTVSLDQYKAALAEQASIARTVDRFLESYDVLVTLSVAGEAPRRDEDEPADSCLLWTLCGLPTINIPAMTGPSGLPIGLQIASRRYNDYLLLEFADFLAERGVIPRASARAG
jgi:Asp-tRNA(Asn)/Glu-tRNA(Gln) amidotransferase A subunit family amidase